MRLVTPKKNPKAYRSPLWAHLENIRKWRGDGDTWRDICTKLAEKPYKITVSVQGLQAFFKRSEKVRNPLGFTISKQPSASQPKQNPVFDIEKLKARAKQKSKPSQKEDEEWPDFDPKKL